MLHSVSMPRAAPSATPRSDFERVALEPDGLGLDARAAAAFFQVTEVTVRRWADGTMQPPGTVRGIVTALADALEAMPRHVRAEAARLVRERITLGVGGLLAEALARAATRAAGAAREAGAPADAEVRREVAALRARVDGLERRLGGGA
jgi:hypothetical protein